MDAARAEAQVALVRVAVVAGAGDDEALLDQALPQ